jgi:hypothetical protein
LNVNAQVGTIVVDTLCCIQYRIYGATHMELYATSLQLISMLDSHAHSNMTNEMPTWLFIHFLQMTYVNTFYNLFTTNLMNIIFNYFIHPFDE